MTIPNHNTFYCLDINILLFKENQKINQINNKKKNLFLSSQVSMHFLHSNDLRKDKLIFCSFKEIHLIPIGMLCVGCKCHDSSNKGSEDSSEFSLIIFPKEQQNNTDHSHRDHSLG
jgi:hypothetical protein